MEYPEGHGPNVEPEASSGIRSIRWRAIIVGVVADVVATMALWSLYASAFLSEKIERYGGLDQIPEQALSEEELFALGLIGVAGTVFGGYVAGRVALSRETWHGALVAVASLALGLGLELAVQGAIRLHWWEVPLLLVTVPAGAFGGYIAERMH